MIVDLPALAEPSKETRYWAGPSSSSSHRSRPSSSILPPTLKLDLGERLDCLLWLLRKISKIFQKISKIFQKYFKNISNLQNYPCLEKLSSFLPEWPRVDAGVTTGSGLVRVTNMDNFPALKYRQVWVLKCEETKVELIWLKPLYCTAGADMIYAEWGFPPFHQVMKYPGLSPAELSDVLHHHRYLVTSPPSPPLSTNLNPHCLSDLENASSSCWTLPWSSAVGFLGLIWRRN